MTTQKLTVAVALIPLALMAGPAPGEEVSAEDGRIIEAGRAQP
jgi:hypothetical protein